MGTGLLRNKYWKLIFDTVFSRNNISCGICTYGKLSYRKRLVIEENIVAYVFGVFLIAFEVCTFIGRNKSILKRLSRDS